jgi:hypothetical protein
LVGPPLSLDSSRRNSINGELEDVSRDGQHLDHVPSNPLSSTFRVGFSIQNLTGQPVRYLQQVRLESYKIRLFICLFIMIPYPNLVFSPSYTHTNLYFFSKTCMVYLTTASQWEGGRRTVQYINNMERGLLNFVASKTLIRNNQVKDVFLSVF